MIEVIAEVGQTNEGSVEKAIAAVEAFAEAGATGVKFQWLTPDLLTTRDAERYWATNEANSQHEAFTEAGMIDYGDWGPVIRACQTRGVEFITTPFDLDAVRAWERYRPEFGGLRTLKIASGDITNHMLIEACARAVGGRGRLLLSTGGATPKEINSAMAVVNDTDCRDVFVLACTLEYPTVRPELGRIRTLTDWAESRNLFGCVGYSDHTTDSDTSFAAVLAGAALLEKHVSLGGDADKVADHAMGLDPAGFSAYVDGAHRAERYLGDGLLGATRGEAAAVLGARRSLYASADIAKGDRFTTANVIPLRREKAGVAPASAWTVLHQRRSESVYLPGDPIRMQ